ncbi:MAG: SpoIIE family protein phosphatase [Bacilli bacterium]|nr:SpoIIE family protein phosphatase [Bacilli bacterium]
MSYLYLILEALLPVVVTIALKFLNYKTKFKKLPYWVKQVIYAIIFGGLAVFGTECGVVINEGVINVRDAPPIIAGLFFGAPAGIVAGLIGGIERLITGYFIAGRAATRIACSVATILAGIISALLRITTRKGKKIQVVTACTLAFLIEVIHMLLVYVTNTNDLEFVIGVYRKVVGPMILGNVVATFLAAWSDLLIDRHFANEKLFKKVRDTQLSGAIQQATLLVAVLTFVVGFASINIIQTGISRENIENTLTATSDTVISKGTTIVNYALGEYANDLHNLYKKYVEEPEETEKKTFKDIFEFLKKDPITGEPDAYEGCYEGYFIKFNGEDMVVEQTSNDNSKWKVNTKVSDDQLFIDLREALDASPTSFNVLEGLKESYCPNKDGVKEKVLYSIAYYGTETDKFVVLSMNSDMINSCVFRNRYYILGNQTYDSGITVTFDKNRNFIGSTDGLIEEDEAVKLLELQGYRTLNQIKFNNDEWYSVATEGELIYAYSIVTIDKAELPARVSMYSSSFLFTFTVGLIFLVANALIDRMIVRKMEKVGDALDKITGDKLNTKVDVYGFEEFNKLSDGINLTVSRLKGYIEEEKNRINKDLEFAKSIQTGTLPYTFPKNRNYDLFADMKTAKHVGGDFYDFFPLNNNRLFFLIADVSGKGVPAAMFMMRAEALIKSLVQNDEMPLDKIMTTVNNELCKNNEAQMFVTCWCAILDVKTGHVDFVNAGHNKPIIKRKGKGFEEINVAKNFVLAGLEGIPYCLESFDLKDGDEVFIYTDGVTEATSKAKKLYGTNRLLNYMNKHKPYTSKEMINGIMGQLDEFQKDAEQADDITMLMIRYKPKTK